MLAIASLAMATTATLYAQNANQGDGIGTPKFVTDQSVTNFSANAQTIVYYRSSFTDPTNGKTYPVTMVGLNPALQKPTTIPTVIIPMSFTFTSFPAGANPTLDGSTKVGVTVASPMFQPTADIGLAASTTASAAPTYPGVAPSPRLINEPTDVTQVADAIVRAQADKTGTGYHLMLGAPTVMRTIYFSVPANQGYMVVGSRSHARIGLMSESWFSDRLQQALRSYHVPSNVLPIFLVYNTFLYTKGGGCCILGYHGAESSLNGNGQQLVHTYMFAAYSDPGIFGAHAGDNGVSYIQDIHALSHEVQEWVDDPFVNNAIDPWLTPTAPQYGCSGLLETGDPVVGYGFTVTMPNGAQYHPEDEVHAPWFERASPSTAAMGYYTYLNNFANRAQGCQ